MNGNFKKFAKLLKFTELDRNNNRLIINGDIFDRGPDSFEVFELVKQLQQEI